MQGKIRVLHVVTSMNRGGLEVWLMEVLRHIDRSRYQLDFLVQTTGRGLFDDEIRSLGGRVIASPRGSRLFSFSRNYLRVLKQYGPYDVVHSHLHHFSAIVAVLSRLAGVRSVIAHSHTARYGDRNGLSVGAKLYLRATEWLLRRFASQGLGCSEEAGQDLFQKDWKNKETHRVLHCGLDLSRFERGVVGAREANLRGKTIIHVGRFNEPKNHAFLLDVIHELRRLRDDFQVKLVGTGPLQPDISAKAEQLGLRNVVEFLGDRNDVPELLLGSELFIFPSLYEGLGLSLVEAQAAGLYCLTSDSIPAEATVLNDLVVSLPLSAGAGAWAARANNLLSAPVRSRELALEKMKSSSFEIGRCIRDLSNLYTRLAA